MGAKEEKERLDGYFETSYPRYVQEAFVKCVHYAYHESYEVCKKFAREEAHDLLGFQRWIELRNQLRGLGGRFSEIKTYSEPKTVKKTGEE